MMNLDMDVLRTLVAAYRLGGFNRAAKHVGRSQSAVSQQIHKLEERIGRPLFIKRGRGLALTEAGEIVLAYARRILDLNDEAITALSGSMIDETLRFGLPNDFAETWLPAALGRFRRACPTARIDVTVERNSVLIERLNKQNIDLALVLGLNRLEGSESLATLPMAWIGSGSTVFDTNQGDPLPLAVLEAPCFFRTAAVAALDAAGIPWRVAFTSPSLAGLWAAVDAGLGITVRTAANKPANLVNVSTRLALPNLPSVELSLRGAANSPALLRLRDILHETMPTALAGRRHRTTATPNLAGKRR
jgi:DNA-binding transcriptional LysR family regulator